MILLASYLVVKVLSKQGNASVPISFIVFAAGVNLSGILYSSALAETICFASSLEIAKSTPSTSAKILNGFSS